MSVTERQAKEVEVFLRVYKNVINISEFERRCKVPSGTLRNAISQTKSYRPIPTDHVLTCAAFLAELWTSTASTLGAMNQLIPEDEKEHGLFADFAKIGPSLYANTRFDTIDTRSGKWVFKADK